MRQVYQAKQKIKSQRMEMQEKPSTNTLSNERDKLLEQMKHSIQTIGLPYVNTVKILAHLKNEKGV